MQNKKSRLIVGAALVATAGVAVGQTTPREPGRSFVPFTNSGYVGGNIGRTDFDADCRAGFGCDQRDLGFKLYTGGQLWRFIGLELGYVNVGKGEASGGSIKAQGVNLSVLANLPVSDRFNIFGKVGSTYGWTKTSAAAPGVATGSDRGFGISYGAGVGFDLARNWQLRGEWDRYRFDFKSGGRDVDMFSIGVAYKF